MSEPAAERLRALEAVLFDLDGTLIDTGDLILASFRHATAAVLGEALPDEELMRNVGMPLRAQLEDMVPGRADEILRAYRAHNQEHHDELARPFPHVDEVLAGVRSRGAPIGVVTSKSRLVAKRGIDLAGIGDYLDVLVSSDDVEVHKPDPYPLRHAAGQLGVELTRCVYVGDSPHDMAAALAGGAVAVAALWGIFSRESLLATGPDYAIEDVRDLLPLLDGTTDA